MKSVSAVRAVLRGAFACAVLAAGMAVAADPDIRVSAAPEGSAVRVDAYALLHAPWTVVWQTLTDYDRLGSFIPGMTSSRVLRREGVAAIVEQTGEARVLMIAIPLNVVVSSEEYPPASIRIHALQGNLRQLEGGYEIAEGSAGAIELRWKGTIEPDTVLPAALTRPILRAIVEAQFRGMVAEIERRAAAVEP